MKHWGIALALLVTAGCAQVKRVSDGLTFHAPDGWRERSEAQEPDVELWQPSDKSQSGILSLSRDLPAFDAGIVVKTLVDNRGRLVERRSMTLCGNQPSTYAQVIQKAPTGNGRYTFEIVTSRTPAVLWEAQYVYATGTTPNVQARAALEELCPAR